MHIPKVSIGMPVYNGEAFIRAAVESLLAQTFKDFELIISDNASTDLTEKICRDYASKDPRIRYVRQKNNIGALGNFLFVLNEAAGDYFMWNAADDYRSSDCVEYYLDNIGSAGGVFSTYAIVDRRSGCIQSANGPILSPNQSRKESLKNFFGANCPAYLYGLFKLNVAKECFLNEAFDWSDSHFVLKVISKYGFNTVQGEPKFYLCYYGAYSPKSVNGKYVHPFNYFMKMLPLAIYAGPVAFVHHLDIFRVGLKVNLKIFLKTCGVLR